MSMKNKLYSTFKAGNYCLAIKLLTSIETTHPVTSHLEESTTGLSGDTLLHLACRHGWLDVVKLLVEVFSFAPDVRNSENVTPLHLACCSGHLDLVQYLVGNQQCDVTAITSDNWTPLHYACRYGNLNIIEYLTSIPNVLESVDHSSILHFTSQHGSSDTLMYLMVKKVLITDPNDEKFPEILFTACEQGNLQMVLHLLKNESNYWPIKLEEYKALFMYCCKNGLSDVLKQLTHEMKGELYQFDDTDECGKSGIHYACQQGNIAIVQHLVEECGWDINNPDRDGFTPLHYACRYGQNVHLLRYMLTRPQCNTSALTCDGSMALHLACSSEEFDPQVTKVLIKHGASFKGEISTFQYVETYLSSKFEFDEPTVRSAMVSCLLDVTGCDPNARNYAGNSPLQISLYPFLAKQILAYHAQTTFYKLIEYDNESQAISEIESNINGGELDLKEVARNGDSVLHMACVANKAKIAKHLLNECNFVPNIKNHAGDTPLTLVLRFRTYRMLSQEGLNNLVSLFLTTPLWNPTLSEKDKDGNNLLHLACKANQEELACCLVEFDNKLTRVKNNNGYTPFELLSYPDSIIKASFELKDAFIYKLKPSSVHHFIWFCNNIIKKKWLQCIITTDHSLKIELRHKETTNCRVGVQMFYLSHHQVWLLTRVCFHPQASAQDAELLDSKISTERFVTEIIDYLVDVSFEGSESNKDLLFVACKRNKYHFVKHLVSTLKCNPDVCCDKNTPIGLATGSDIIQLLILHGAKLQPSDINSMLVNKHIIPPDPPTTLKQTKQWSFNSVYNSQGDTALHLAIKHHIQELALYLLSEPKCDPNIRNLNGDNPVQLLLSERSWSDPECIQGIKAIVSTGLWDPNSSCNLEGDTALHLSAMLGRHALMHHLLCKVQCDPTVKNEEGKTPIRLLISENPRSYSKCASIFKYLPASTESQDVSNCYDLKAKECMPFFMYCCKNGLLDLIMWLTHQMHNVAFTVDKSGKLGVHYACQNGHTATVRHLIEDCGCSINMPDKDGLTPLHLACKYGQSVDLVKYILSRPDCDSSARTNDNNTALHFACSTEAFDSQVINVLFKRGFIKNKDLFSTVKLYLNRLRLETSESSVKSSIVTLLLDVGKCVPNVKNYDGNSPVMICVSAFIVRQTITCHAETNVYKWIQYDSEGYAVYKLRSCIHRCELDLNETASNGDSVLHMACVANKLQIATYLLNECNFDPDIKNHAGDTPLTLALRFHTYRMLSQEDLDNLVSLFLTTPHWNPTLSEKDKDGNNLLHLACKANQEELVSFLEEFDGTLKHAKNKSGHIPFKLLSNPNIIVDCVMKGVFTYTIIPGSIHQFLWLSENLEKNKLQHIFTDDHLKIKWKHKETMSLNCRLGHHNLYLPSHQVWILLRVCFHSRTTGQGESALCTNNQDIFIVDILDHVMDDRFKGEESNEELLFIACRKNRFKFVKYLISLPNCSPNDLFDKDVLIKITNNSDIVRFVSNHMHNNSNGDTALHLSLRYHRPEIVHYLLSEIKCNPNIKNGEGKAPIHLLISIKSWSDLECINVINILISTGQWDPNSSCNSNGDTALHLSVLFHRCVVANHLLSRAKSDPNIYNLKRENAIHLLIRSVSLKQWSDSDCISIIKQSIESNQSWNPNSVCNSNGDTALYLSILYHTYKVAQYLLCESKCHLNLRNKDGDHLITQMISMKSWTDSECINMIKLMISCQSSSPNSSWNCNGDTALHLSIRYHRCNVTRYLLDEAKCNPDIKNQNGDTPIQLLLPHKSWTDLECLDIIKILYSSNTRLWNPNTTCNSKGDTALHLSLWYHRYSVTWYLLSKTFCDPNIRNQDGNQPFSLLISVELWTDSECKIIIELLLSKKLWDPNSVCNSHGDTAFHLLLRHRRLEVAIYLLSSTKCDPHKANFCGIQPVFTLLSSQSFLDSECINIIKSLVLFQSWNPNLSCSNNGDTALHVSINYRRYTVTQFLLSELKCNPNIENRYRETQYELLLPFIVERESKWKTMIKTLVCTKQWDLNSWINSHGDTVLHISVRKHRYDLAHYLIAESKCDPYIKNKNGETPLQLMLTKSCPECFNLIKDIKSTGLWNFNSSCNFRRDTALHVSVKNYRYDITHFLITECKCDPNIKNQNGETPVKLLIAAVKLWSDSECISIIKAIASTGLWNPNSTCNPNKDTALHLSAKFKRFEVAYYLLTEAKCNHSMENLKGETQCQLLVPSMILSLSDSQCESMIKALKSVNWDSNSICNNSGDTALHLSVLNYRLNITHFLIITECKCDPNIKNQSGDTPVKLLIAAVNSWSDSECIGIIKAIASTGLWDPNSTCDPNEDTALHLSAKFERLEVAYYLLTEAKCDPNMENLNGETQYQLLVPSMMYSRKVSDFRCKSMIKALKSVNWDSNSICNNNGDTALHISILKYHLHTTQFLITECKCDPNIKNQSGETPVKLLIAAVNSWSDSECIGILKAMMSTGLWDPNSTCDPNEDTALHLSAKFERLEVANYLLTKTKCDPNMENLIGETQYQLLVRLMIHSLSDSQCESTIKALKLVNWDSNSTCNNSGDTALHLSVMHYKFKVVFTLLTETKCDPNIKNKRGETPIQLFLSVMSWSDNECIDIINCIILMSTGQWDPNSSCNSNGDTALHLSVWYHRHMVTKYLLFEAMCDPNIKNKRGDTPFKLLFSEKSWSDNQCVDIIKHTMSTGQWNPDSSCNSNGDTALHLSVCHGRYELAQYLLSEAKCDPTIKNLKGDAQVQLLLPLIIRTWSDSECKEMIKALISSGKWDPNSSVNFRGDTALHLSARHHRAKIVHFLLSEINCDPNVRNTDEESPSEVTYDTSIIDDLIRHGANPENVYKFHGKSAGLPKPLVPPVKILIIGNSGVGKSTLTEALKIENSMLVRMFAARKRVSSVDEKTAGIVPHEFESTFYGRVIFYDFAGQREFYNSHIAILQNVIRNSSPIFVIVVNFSKSEEEIQQNLHYWLYFLENNCNTTHSKPHVIIIGSHADIVLNNGEDPQQAASNMLTYIQEKSQHLTLECVGVYPVDCRYSESSTMNKLRNCLKDTCKVLRIPDTISLNAHCFYAFLLDKFRTSVAVTIDDLQKEIGKHVDNRAMGVINYIPDSISALNSLCDELNHRGHILYLKNNNSPEKSWIIIDKMSLLSKVTGTIFAPKDFKEHCQIAESTGVVPLSRLSEIFPDHNSEVLVGFLTHLEFCHKIDDQELHKLITEHHESLNCATITELENEHYFLFPGLITLNAPSSIWKSNSNFKHYCFWTIRCTRQNQFFSSRFTQVLLLRLAFSFALIKTEVNPSIPALQRECSMWKNGIFWGEIFGMEIIVEIHANMVLLLIRCSKENLLHCIAQRSSIIQKILHCVHDICSKLETVEYFIDPAEATTFPVKMKSPVSSEIPQFSLKKIAEAIVKSTDCASSFVVSSTGTISLDNLLTFEPYAEVGISALRMLYSLSENDVKKVSDSFLKYLNDQFSRKANLFSKLFDSSSSPSHLPSNATEDLLTKLRRWRDKCNGTYKWLKHSLDQFSVFTGRNVLQLATLETSHDVSRMRDSDEQDFGEPLTTSKSNEQIHSEVGQTTSEFNDTKSTLIEESASVSFPEAFPDLHDAPKLHQLHLLERDGTLVKVIDMVAAQWESVTTRLHFESYDISRIDRDHHQQSIQATVTVFGEWIKGKGRQPTSWHTLIKALKETRLQSVASDLESIFVDQCEPGQLNINKHTFQAPQKTEMKTSDTNDNLDQHHRSDEECDKCSLPNPNFKPEIAELLLLGGHGRSKIRIIESVADQWKDLAVALDFNEERIDRIDSGASGVHEEACQQMFEEWLGEDDDLKEPVTWTTLVQCLIDAGMIETADRLKEIICQH